MLEKTTTVNLLFDYYHSLLKERQKIFLQMYYHEDLSLSEIAELQQISRQAVYEQIKKAEQTLYDWENKLQLLARDRKREQVLDELQSCIQQLEEQQTLNDENAIPSLNKMRSMVEKLRAIDEGG